MTLTRRDIRQQWASPPNLVSYVRLLLVIPISLLVLQPGFAGWIAFGLLLIATLSDKLDGWLAKRNDGRWITTWGKLIDPIIDKVLVGVVQIVICVQVTGSTQLVVISVAAGVLLRELGVAWIKSRRPIESAGEAGRFSMAMQSAALLWFCLPLIWPLGDIVQFAPLLLGLGASFTSGWLYFVEWRDAA